MGVASASTVSEIRGYDKNEAEKALKEKAARAALIVGAQTKAAENGGTPVEKAGARGVSDLDPNPDSAKEEKQESQGRDTNIDLDNGTRGES